MATHGLTPRERDVIMLLVEGMTNRDIALALDLSEGTVKYYLSSIFRKLGASNRTEAAVKGLSAIRSEVPHDARSPSRGIP